LLGITVLVLLIVCVNIANLLLAPGLDSAALAFAAGASLATVLVFGLVPAWRVSGADAAVLAGSWLPARRATRIAPTQALRYE
jgi:ABC-type antimicrobial peptide transport system permease subunit